MYYLLHPHNIHHHTLNNFHHFQLRLHILNIYYHWNNSLNPYLFYTFQEFQKYLPGLMLPSPAALRIVHNQSTLYPLP